MQVIDRPKQTLLPFSLRKKVHTQESPKPKVQTFRIGHPQKQNLKMKIKLKKLDSGKKPKFICYHLGDIDPVTRKLIKNMMTDNVRVMRSRKSGPVLLSENFIQNMSQNMKGVPYNSAKYLAIVPLISDIFKQTLAIPDNNILMSTGQISQNYYLFFDNCFQIPHSLCCNQVIYLKIQLQKQLSKSLSLRNHGNFSPTQISGIKTQLICRKCKKQILCLYGEDLGSTGSGRFSPQRVKKEIQLEDQRRKFSIGVMIGSGKHKTYRIVDNNKNTCPQMPIKFNPETIFSTDHSNHMTKRSIYETIEPKTTILNRPTTLRNDFYHIFNQ